VKNSPWVAWVTLFSSRPCCALVTVTNGTVGLLYLGRELVEG